jgi:hypothetical protein
MECCTVLQEKIKNKLTSVQENFFLFFCVLTRNLQNKIKMCVKLGLSLRRKEGRKEGLNEAELVCLRVKC